MSYPLLLITLTALVALALNRGSGAAPASPPEPGVSGWLLLIGLFLVLMVLGCITGLIVNSVGTLLMPPWFDRVAWLAIVLNAVLGVVSVAAGLAFYGRSRFTPALTIILIALVAATEIAGSIAQLFTREGGSEGQLLLAILAAIAAYGWIRYLLVSARVRATFVQ